ncbi:MAG: serine--tRNA ligase [Deltaproteobacteria bacterium]|nr:serine--tRNA ligase [Deltaproteobacteria bacterium]
MLDLKRIRKDPAAVKAQLSRRRPDLDGAIDELLGVDEQARTAIQAFETLQARRKQLSEQIGRKKKANEDTSTTEAEVRELAETIRITEQKREELDRSVESKLLNIPNAPHESVPVGDDSSDNPVVHTHGTVPSFNFTPKDHVELGEKLAILDFERAAKIAGARFSVLIGKGAQLERALAQFMLDVHSREHGYTECSPPLLVEPHSALGTGQLPKFREDMFAVRLADGAEKFLIPTAEVPVTNLHREEILPEESLPKRYVAHTPCFRSEAGSYGKDTRGLIRQHQFYKVELVQFVHPSASYEVLEQLTAHAEKILDLLELPYRRVTLCTGDLGFSSAKTYDLEVWLPSQKAYREISSCSNFEDFQARRTQIRFKPKGGGKPEFVHTLNGSGLAVGRTWLALLENHQREDGTVAIPRPLQPYMGGLTELRP